MRKFLAAALCAAGLGLGIAAPAEATLTRYQAAMQAATYDCLRYTGCSQLAINQVAVSGSCRRYHYNFHTTYYGWLDAWTGPYCSPPYAP
jgi:hypothetical protein